MFVRWQVNNRSLKAYLLVSIRQGGRPRHEKFYLGTPPIYLYLTESQARDLMKKLGDIYPKRTDKELLELMKQVTLLDRNLVDQLGEPAINFYLPVDLPVIPDGVTEGDLQNESGIWNQIAQIYYRVLARFCFAIFAGSSREIGIEEIATAAYVFPASVFDWLSEHANWLSAQAGQGRLLPHGLELVSALFQGAILCFREGCYEYNNDEVNYIKVLASDIITLDELAIQQGAVEQLEELRGLVKAAFRMADRESAHPTEVLLNWLMRSYGEHKAVGQLDYVKEAVDAWRICGGVLVRGGEDGQEKR